MENKIEDYGLVDLENITDEQRALVQAKIVEVLGELSELVATGEVMGMAIICNGNFARDGAGAAQEATTVLLGGLLPQRTIAVLSVNGLLAGMEPPGAPQGPRNIEELKAMLEATLRDRLGLKPS